MKLIKKIAQTPLDAIAKVINSWTSGDDKTKNAPSIQLVSDKFAEITASIADSLADIGGQITDLGNNIFNLWRRVEDITVSLSQYSLTNTYNSQSTAGSSRSITLSNGVYMVFVDFSCTASFSGTATEPSILTAEIQTKTVTSVGVEDWGTFRATVPIETYWQSQGALRGSGDYSITKSFPVVVSEDTTIDLSVRVTSTSYSAVTAESTVVWNVLRLHEQSS